ncbi:hypothetical protein K450DRAFT_262501 [Umbelopsis ramanniana AG]|uniref:Uncharacterized protein n=1 Tax=Umbelopsis ramanniana AG TaxID=1314678 RepID=A0AAD5H7J2_UMBRA|nr:uncharacterized protein K450DRAFT_262501 [Umbelopsis ramanniana AG]KAI8575265.1 hypothetical protein K450DRAFT_262501 [Umbelopsis ramanniana AG]
MPVKSISIVQARTTISSSCSDVTQPFCTIVQELIIYKNESQSILSYCIFSWLPMFRSKSTVNDPVITSSLDSGKASIVRRATEPSLSSPSTPQSFARGEDYFTMANHSSGTLNGTPGRMMQRENSQSSFGSGMASIRMSSDVASSRPNLSQETFEVVDLQASPNGHAQYDFNKSLPEAPAETSQDVTVESMTAVLAAAVQMSTNPGKSLSSLSLGSASIVPSTSPPADPRPSPGISVRTSRLFSFSAKKPESSSPALTESVSTPTSASSGASLDSSGATTPSRFTLFSRRSGNNIPTKENKVTEDEDENGMRELEYRGITVKEIKGTLKTMVIPDNVKNPMPESKIQRPGFARVIY